MNQVLLIGRITKDIDLKYTGTQNLAKATFSVAINEKDRTNYPRIIAWEKEAENVERYCGKGSLIAIEGRIQTGSYEKNGQTVYTTDVIANHIEYLTYGKGEGESY